MSNTTLASSAQIWGKFVEKTPEDIMIYMYLTFLYALFCVFFFFVLTPFLYKDNNHEIKNHRVNF